MKPSCIFIFGHIIAFRVPHDAGKRCGIVNVLMKMCGARGTLCSLATLLKTAPFDAEFEVFVWRGSLKNPKKLIISLGGYFAKEDIYPLKYPPARAAPASGARASRARGMESGRI